MKRSPLVVLAAIALVAGLFFYMSTANAKQECRVCVEYGGRSNCASAAGATAEQAREGAQATACGPLAHGMNETIACGRTPARLIQCKKR